MFLSRKLIYESLCISINYAGNILHFNSKDLLDRFGLVEYTYDYKDSQELSLEIASNTIIGANFSGLSFVAEYTIKQFIERYIKK